MAGPIISKLLTDFFNEIGPLTDIKSYPLNVRFTAKQTLTRRCCATSIL